MDSALTVSTREFNGNIIFTRADATDVTTATTAAATFTGPLNGRIFNNGTGAITFTGTISLPDSTESDINMYGLDNYGFFTNGPAGAITLAASYVETTPVIKHVYNLGAITGGPVGDTLKFIGSIITSDDTDIYSLINTQPEQSPIGNVIFKMYEDDVAIPYTSVETTMNIVDGPGHMNIISYVDIPAVNIKISIKALSKISGTILNIHQYTIISNIINT
jgi:hypothetical protein